MARRRKFKTMTRPSKGKMPEGKYLMLRESARRRNKPIDITSGQYFDLVYDAACYYCGGNLPAFGPGLDRVDNNAGYVLSNVVPCCGPCNQGKRCMTADEWKAVIRHRVDNDPTYGDR